MGPYLTYWINNVWSSYSQKKFAPYNAAPLFFYKIWKIVLDFSEFYANIIWRVNKVFGLFLVQWLICYFYYTVILP